MGLIEQNSSKITFGFWRTKPEQYPVKIYSHINKSAIEMYPDLTFPEANAEKWEGQDEFLEKFKKIQEKANRFLTKGFSICRLCGCVNGSVEYRNSWGIWPEGAIHYIEKHNVRPSQEFINKVMGV